MYQLKQMLTDLVDIAYADDERIGSYKAFYIEVIEKVYKSKHGDYNINTRHIRIMNPYRDENKLIITAIHELAHHINNMQKNEDIHGKGFYANYEKLLHAALDMQLFDKSSYLKLLRDSRDAIDERKVQKMIQAYRPKEIGYKKDITKLIVFGAYDVKEILKEKGFKYNKISKAWEIELSTEDSSEMELFLEKNGIKYEASTGNKYIVKSEKDKEHIIAVYDSYAVKDELKENGFKFRNKDSAWCIGYSGKKDEGENIIRTIRKICNDNKIKVKKLENYGNEIRITLEKKRSDA